MPANPTVWIGKRIGRSISLLGKLSVMVVISNKAGVSWFCKRRMGKATVAC